MPKTIQQLVHEQIASKIAAGEALETAVAAVHRAQRELAARASDAATARRQAMKAGWSETELRSLGLASRGRSPRRTAPLKPVSNDPESGLSK
ncbi:hypothetical protein QMG83_15285 [Salinibacterium sp. G-O1]|uniref:hypothetical protein n=1 Tax=Salinibacterium sp. G-O1 TaxID=3046208 RepID=UPI0024BBCF45|nr:hypothetical protein [Salinibacterium sp. G-O1]MDJ0336591.1 hypothetical protein [Salinibacterium sp. G-O1]